ncbi:hypothetical protein pb186bvf_015237 [Paramecium bursaria]
MQFKIILLGDTYVGKSSLLKRFSDDSFLENIQPSVGMAYCKKVIERKNLNITLEIWDTAGQEKFRKIAPIYYRNAQAVVLCFDCSKPDTLDGVKRWLDEIDKYLTIDCIKYLVGNKADICEYNMKQEYLTANNLHYIQTSAKTGQNVHKLFRRIARMLAKSKLKKMENLERKTIVTLQVQGPEEVKKNRLCC